MEVCRIAPKLKSPMFFEHEDQNRKSIFVAEAFPISKRGNLFPKHYSYCHLQTIIELSKTLFQGCLILHNMDNFDFKSCNFHGFSPLTSINLPIKEFLQEAIQLLYASSSTLMEIKPPLLIGMDGG